jgi:hypothetical protein
MDIGRFSVIHSLPLLSASGTFVHFFSSFGGAAAGEAAGEAEGAGAAPAVVSFASLSS